jgi:DNA-binding transcriptional regulator YdaS (Cro superfamily)
MGRKNSKRRDAALEHAIQAAGGAAELARALGITVQSISEWKRCPPRRAIEVERATKGIVSRNRLRPDLYPIET